MILTGNQIDILKNIRNSENISIKADLGKSSVEVTGRGDFLDIWYKTDQFQITHSDLRKIRTEEDALYYVDPSDGEIFKIQLYSEMTGQYYRLVNTGEQSPPTVEISGIKMHVTQGQDPSIDTRNKLATYRENIHGRVLDTCCGLGYTSIAFAHIPAVESVIVVERDPNILTLCQLNPFSADLFSHPKIYLIRGDTSELIQTFPDNYFNFILHDPPRFALAPELYHPDFYAECYRILKEGGEIYHYTGDPNKGLRKQSLQSKTAARLKEAGFDNVRKVYQGVWAKK